MALTQQQILAAQQWLNQNYGGSSPTGQGWDFEKAGFSMPNDTRLGANILGAAQGMGYDDAALSQILGYTPEQIGSYRTDNFEDQYNNEGFRNNQIDRASLTFATDMGFTNSEGNRNNLLDNGGRFGWEGGADGGYTQSMRDVFGNVRYQDDPTTGGGGSSGSRTLGNAWSNRQSGTNPYLDQMAQAMGQQWTDTLNEQWLPQIRDQSIAAGGLGGSRAGVAQAGAIGKAGQGYAGALAQLYGGAFENQQNRDLGYYQADLGYDLGQTNAQNNFYTSQRGQDLAQLGLGAQMYGQGMQGAWGPLTNAGGIYGSLIPGTNSTSQTGSQGGGWQGALGGLLGTAQFGSNMGWWGK